MHESTKPEHPLTPELIEAHRNVELAKAELQQNLHDVRDSGRQAIVRMVKNARPVLVVAAVVLGVFVLARLARSRRSRRKRRSQEPSMLGILARAAARGASRALAVRAAEQAAERIVLLVGRGESDTQAPDELDASASSPPSDDGFVQAGSLSGLTSCVNTAAAK